MKPRALRAALPRETTLAFCVTVAPVGCDKRVMKSFSDALCALTEVRGARPRRRAFVSCWTWKQLPHKSLTSPTAAVFLSLEPRPPRRRSLRDMTLTLPPHPPHTPLPCSPRTCLDLLLHLPASSSAPRGQTVWFFFWGAARENTKEFNHERLPPCFCRTDSHSSPPPPPTPLPHACLSSARSLIHPVLG